MVLLNIYLSKGNTLTNWLSRNRRNATKILAATHAKELLLSRPLFLDTETTGIGSTDQILECSIIDNTGVVLLDTLIKPTVPISHEASTIHGIDNTKLAGAPSFVEILPTIKNILDERTLIIYNADFDLRMLKQTARVYNISFDISSSVHCAMRLYAEFHGDWNEQTQAYRWQKLEVAARQCCIEIPQRLHRAKIDAEITRQIFIYMADCMK